MCDLPSVLVCPLALQYEPIGPELRTTSFAFLHLRPRRLRTRHWRSLRLRLIVPTKANQEDHVSTAPWAARKAQLVIKNLRRSSASRLLRPPAASGSHRTNSASSKEKTRKLLSPMRRSRNSSEVPERKKISTWATSPGYDQAHRVYELLRAWKRGQRAGSSLFSTTTQSDRCVPRTGRFKT